MARSESPSLISVSRRGSMPDDEDARYTVVWVRGEHDIATKISLVLAIARAARRDDADVLVDLSEVTFMDASTIGAIVGSRNRLRARSQSLAVRAPSPPARRLLELCGLAILGHSPALQAVHPAGVAAALSTWVDVPSTQTLCGLDHDAEGTVLSAELDPVDARRSRAGATLEVHRGGP